MQEDPGPGNRGGAGSPVAVADEQVLASSALAASAAGDRGPARRTQAGDGHALS